MSKKPGNLKCFFLSSRPYFFPACVKRKTKVIHSFLRWIFDPLVVDSDGAGAPPHDKPVVTILVGGRMYE